MIGEIISYNDGNMLGNRLVEHMELVTCADDKAKNHVRHLMVLRTDNIRYGILDFEETVSMVWWYPKAKSPEDAVKAYSKEMEKMRKECGL